MSTEAKRIVWPALCTVVTIAAIAFIFATTRIGHGAYSKADLANSPPASVPPLLKPIDSTVTPPIADDDDKGFWLTIRATGFETKEMTITAGDYFVIVQNGTGLDQFGLRIEREKGQRIHEMRLPRLKKRWRQMIRFTPGSYIVSEIDHPEWTCRITVTAPQ